MNDKNHFELDAEEFIREYELDKKMTADQLKDFKRSLEIRIMVESQIMYCKDIYSAQGWQAESMVFQNIVNKINESAKELDKQYKNGWRDGRKALVAELLSKTIGGHE